LTEKVSNFKCDLSSWWPVTEEQLKDVAEVSQVLEADQDFLESEFKSKCEEYIPFPEQVRPDQCADAFVYLKQKFMQR
jgi:hypothetical protein